jgi:hypothetical protein
MEKSMNNKVASGINIYPAEEVYNLPTAIISLSIAKNWDEARAEWYLDHVEFADNFENYDCICGHKNIKELCYIQNRYNDSTALVGNCCVKKFMNECGSDRIFQALKDERINEDLANYCHHKEIINDWEHGFLLDVWRKRKMSHKQRRKFLQIRDKIMGVMKK